MPYFVDRLIHDSDMHVNTGLRVGCCLPGLPAIWFHGMGLYADMPVPLLPLLALPLYSRFSAFSKGVAGMWSIAPQAQGLR